MYLEKQEMVYLKWIAIHYHSDCNSSAHFSDSLQWLSSVLKYHKELIRDSVTLYFKWNYFTSGSDLYQVITSEFDNTADFWSYLFSKC